MCLALPSALLLFYLLQRGVQLWPLTSLPSREWTLPQRLLTEPRVLWTYVGHLLSLGLLQVGPEEPSLKDDYQILMAESPVLKAIKAGAKGPIPARIEKATVRLSGLGLALWDATSGSNS